MNIVVLVKQVPAISDIEIAKDNNWSVSALRRCSTRLINTPSKRP